MVVVPGIPIGGGRAPPVPAKVSFSVCVERTVPCGAYDLVSVSLESKFMSVATRTAERFAPIEASSIPWMFSWRFSSYFCFATS